MNLQAARVRRPPDFGRQRRRLHRLQIGRFAHDGRRELAGAGKRMAIDHLARQPERNAEPSHFVLEQIAQRLQQLSEKRRISFAAELRDRLVRQFPGIAFDPDDEMGPDRVERRDGIRFIEADAYR